MEFLKAVENVYNVVPEIVFEIIAYLGTACAMLFLYFSSKYYNKELKVKWYICAFFFPFITSMVHLSKSKEYKRTAGMKICPSCGDRCPSNFQICNRCLVELPEFDKVKSDKNKKLSRIFLFAFILLFVVDLATGALAISGTVSDLISGVENAMESFDEYPERISFEADDGAEIYYDRNGEENYDNVDFPIYDRKGNKYCFVTEANGIGYCKDDGKSEHSGEEIFSYEYCFVDEDGYFVYSEKLNVPDENAEYEYYFEAPYTDDEGNRYYSAISASWNEKGELITSVEQLEE